LQKGDDSLGMQLMSTCYHCLFCQTTLWFEKKREKQEDPEHKRHIFWVILVESVKEQKMKNKLCGKTMQQSKCKDGYFEF
jgi:hypothetical protein